jgi:hypothetical protein
MRRWALYISGCVVVGLGKHETSEQHVSTGVQVVRDRHLSVDVAQRVPRRVDHVPNANPVPQTVARDLAVELKEVK